MPGAGRVRVPTREAKAHGDEICRARLRVPLPPGEGLGSALGPALGLGSGLGLGLGLGVRDTLTCPADP